MKKISWFSPGSIDVSGVHWYSQGYSNAAISTIGALREKDVAVFYNRNEIPFHVNFCQPHYYQMQSLYKVGYTPWESTKIPIGWKYNMQQMDEIWATSNFVKDVYVQNNVHHNIHVIPHGISDEFKIIDREVTGTFNFLHVGGDSKRKNAQMVVDAFLDLYEGNADFKLVLKYNGFCQAEVYIDNNLVPAIQHPQIYGIPDNLSTEDLVKLYHKCHCLVYPTSGEGFGMIPFEAICTGMPTIVTDATGCSDFAKYSIPLSCKMGNADWNSHQYGEDTGLWAYPDMEQLMDLMTHVVSEYDEFKKYTIQSARTLHNEHSWSSVADKILERIIFYENNFS
jgi:glycosyltransferase involved in cell wall biosynthesis